MRQVGYLQGSYQDARSTKYKIVECAVTGTKIANHVTADYLNCQRKFKESVEVVNTQGEEAN